MSRAALVAAIALTLAACSAGDTTPDPSASPRQASADAATPLSLTDTWVKAADSGMTAAFGVLTNSGDADITVVAAHSEVASAVELHEVVDDTMRPVEGGFVVPAGETLTLEPGGYHLMFMGLEQPILAGDEVTITLELDDASELTFTAVAKDFAGGNEEYVGDMDMGASASPSMAN